MKLDKNKKDLIKRIALAIFVSIVASAVYSYRYALYYFYLKLRTPKTKDAENNKIIEGLHPIFAYRIAKLVKSREDAGHSIILTSGFRSWEEQTALYEAGITPAQAGSSLHNYGLAVDLNEDGQLKMNSSTNAWLDSGIIAESEKLGLRWGGYFSQVDRVHFDFAKQYEINQLKSLHNDRELVKNKFVKIW